MDDIHRSMYYSRQERPTREQINDRLEIHKIYQGLNNAHKFADFTPANVRMDKTRGPLPPVTSSMIAGLHGPEQIKVPTSNPALQKMVVTKDPVVLSRDLTGAVNESLESRDKINDLMNARMFSNHFMALKTPETERTRLENSIALARSTMYQTRMDE